MSSTSEYKRRTMDTFGSGSPEEWSQRIKSLQNQVDEDGLQEQQRLEADIARSRIDRAKRRSTLASPTRIDPGAGRLHRSGRMLSDSQLRLAISPRL